LGGFDEHRKLANNKKNAIIKYTEVKMEITISDEKLKETLKEVLIELLQENRIELISVLSESIEDFIMGESIEEGLKTKVVSKEEIMKELK